MDTVAILESPRGRRGPELADYLSYLYLFAGVLVMLGPVFGWSVVVQGPGSAGEFPPSIPPTPGNRHGRRLYDPLPLFDVTLENGEQRQLAQVRRIGLEAQMIDPASPDEIIRVHINDRQEIRSVPLATENYTDPLERFNFLTYLRNSVVVTVVATCDNAGDQQQARSPWQV